MLCLFSAKLSNNEKSKMANRLLSYKPNITEFYKFEKPVLPVVSEKTELLTILKWTTNGLKSILNFGTLIRIFDL